MALVPGMFPRDAVPKPSHPRSVYTLNIGVILTRAETYSEFPERVTIGGLARPTLESTLL
jgi:hypothetical protein